VHSGIGDLERPKGKGPAAGDEILAAADASLSSLPDRRPKPVREPEPIRLVLTCTMARRPSDAPRHLADAHHDQRRPHPTSGVRRSADRALARVGPR
jgi:hypothetical protein